MVDLEVVLFWLEVTTLIVAVLLIFFSLFKQTLSQEVLSSISGGSQVLFSNRKIQLRSSLLLIILGVFSALLVSLSVTIRIVINVG